MRYAALVASAVAAASLAGCLELYGGPGQDAGDSAVPAPSRPEASAAGGAGGSPADVGVAAEAAAGGAGGGAGAGAGGMAGNDGGADSPAPAVDTASVDLPAETPPQPPACMDECAVMGERRCEGVAIAECRRLAIGCLGWGTATPCPVPQSCKGTAGAVICECPADACTRFESQRCGPGGGLQTCVQNNACPSWSAEAPCAGGLRCSAGGATGASCAGKDARTEGAFRCSSAGVQRCGATSAHASSAVSRRFRAGAGELSSDRGAEIAPKRALRFPAVSRR